MSALSLDEKEIYIPREMLCGHSADIVRTYISRDICPHFILLRFSAQVLFIGCVDNSKRRSRFVQDYLICLSSSDIPRSRPVNNVGFNLGQHSYRGDGCYTKKNNRIHSSVLGRFLHNIWLMLEIYYQMIIYLRFFKIRQCLLLYIILLHFIND